MTWKRCDGKAVRLERAVAGGRHACRRARPSEPRVALVEFRADPVAHACAPLSGGSRYPTQAEAYGLPAIPSYVEILPDAQATRCS